jgi:predicted TIM-barrel fold metal-dependent hydrolase
MSFAGYEHALGLLESHRATLPELLPDSCPVVDVHTHLGLDEDGMSLTLEQHLESMRRNRIVTSFVFPLNDPERHPAYRVPNDRVLGWASESEGRLIPFVRLALGDDDPLAEAERCIDLGARGIKLHPRSQAFSVTDPRFEAVFTLAAERRIPVLIHAGRGLPPGLGEELAHIAARHPEASLILAHAAIADQGPITSFANGMPNVFFDTSTWSPLDLLSLLARVGPEQVLFASDIPYGDQFYHQYLCLGALRRVGCTDDQVRAVLGGTASRLIHGELPERISPPRSGEQITLDLDRVRISSYLAAVIPLLWGGGMDAIGLLGLAASCCAGNDGLAGVHELIVATEIAWAGLIDLQPDARRLETRRLFRVVGLAQALALYG